MLGKTDVQKKKNYPTGNSLSITSANVQTVNYTTKQNVVYIIKNALTVIEDRVGLCMEWQEVELVREIVIIENVNSPWLAAEWWIELNRDAKD